jgi:hypothetical protein
MATALIPLSSFFFPLLLQPYSVQLIPVPIYFHLLLCLLSSSSSSLSTFFIIFFSV